MKASELQKGSWCIDLGLTHHFGFAHQIAKQLGLKSIDEYFGLSPRYIISKDGKYILSRSKPKQKQFTDKLVKLKDIQL